MTLRLVTDNHPARDRGADANGLTRLGECSAAAVFGVQRITTGQSTCRDWTYWLEPDGDDVFRFAVRYAPTGQVRRFDTLDIDVPRAWTGNGARRDLFVDAVTVLDDPAADAARRAAAIAAVHHFDVLSAICVCGGYLALMPGQVWTHVDVCDACLTRPDECLTAADRLAHPMHQRARFEGETARCDVAEAALCEHCCKLIGDYEASRACGAGKKVCCGTHDCDTAMASLTWMPKQRPGGDPLDGAALTIIAGG